MRDMPQMHLDAVPAKAGQWCAAIRLPDGEKRAFTLQCDGAPPVPDVLDGLAAAVLPLAMRKRAALRVHGPITRQALRGLTEFAQAWTSWNRAMFYASPIVPDEVRDETASTEPSACVAWSGSLASTHTLVRHVDSLMQGAFPVGAVVRVVAVRRGDEVGLDSARAAMESLHIPFYVVRTNAREAGLVDRKIGRLPVVAAGLHWMGGNYGCGIHGRGWLIDAHRHHPRPGVALPDLLSGGRLPIRADGGFVAPSVQVSDVQRHELLARSMQETLKSRPWAERAVASLAFRAAGCPRSGTFRDVVNAALLPMWNQVVAADAAAIAGMWNGGKGVHSVLKTRLLAQWAWVVIRDHLRWFASASNLGPVAPR